MDFSALGRIRRSEGRNLRSLAELSLQSVIYNVDSYCEREDEPFACLPQDVMTVLIETERRYSKTQSGAMHAHRYRMHCTPEQLISWNTQRVYLEAFGWEDDVIERLLRRIMYKSADCLLALQMSYCSPRTQSTVHRMLPRVWKLRKLEVNGRLGNDDLLAVVGENLDQLREIAIDSHTISDLGLGYLHVRDKSRGKCQQLETLILNSNNEVTSHGLLATLENLHKLKHVHHRALVKAIFMFSQKYPSKSLILEGEVFGKQEKLKITEENIEKFLKTVPNLKNINFLTELLKNINTSQLCIIKNVDKLELNIGLIPINFMKDLVENYNSKLKCIKIESTSLPVDISIIAKYCPNLEDLQYKCKTVNTFEYKFENTFENIRNISIEDVSQNFPVQAIKSLLSSEKLEFVTFVTAVNVTDDSLQEIFLHGITNKEIFSKLKMIRFCFIDGISVISLQNFVCFSPILESIEISACANISPIDYVALYEFIELIGCEGEIELL